MEYFCSFFFILFLLLLEFNQKFNLQIQRNNTKFVRIISRKELKLEIYYKA